MHGNPAVDPSRETDRDGDEPLPPPREQLPLPRRDVQTHLEPQLREQHGAGTGTPFAAFGTDGSAQHRPEPDAASNSGSNSGSGSGSGERAAAFRAATRGAPGDVGPHRPR